MLFTHRQDNGIRHKRLDSTVGETVMKHRVTSYWLLITIHDLLNYVVGLMTF